MKAKMIAAGAVLSAMLALCLYAMWTVQTDAESLRNLEFRAQAAAENGDFAGAEALLNNLQMKVDERRGVLEVLALHEDLNQVSSAAAVAQVQLKYGQNEEFQATMALMLEALMLLDERQRLTWSNLF